MNETLPEGFILAEKEDLFLPWTGEYFLRPDVQYFFKMDEKKYKAETTNNVGMFFLKRNIELKLIYIHKSTREKRVI